MDIFDKARELGQLILSSDAAKAQADARAVFLADKPAQEAMLEYVQYKNGVEKGQREGVLEKEALNLAYARLEEMLDITRQIPTISELISAEESYNFFVNQILSIIKETIMFEDEQGCKCGHSHCCHEVNNG